jgi:hypothetical protein
MVNGRYYRVMSKVITSPVEKWPGTVTLSDPLTFEQAIAVEKAFDAVRELGEGVSHTEQDLALIPAVVACVELWKLEGLSERVTVDTFPATPRRSSARLIAWLVTEIGKLFAESEELPLA